MPLVSSNLFSNLHADGAAGQLKVLWAPELDLSATAATVHASAASATHWPTRDWRSYEMARNGQTWQAIVPVEDVDVPIVYYLQATSGDVTNFSPLRLLQPRAAGMEEPTRHFWPFIEGFEEGIESWQLLAPVTPQPLLTLDSAAKNGRAALVVHVPAGKQSATVATTRVRGWQLEHEAATGLRLWLRTRAGTGRARCTLLSQGLSTNQVVHPWPNQIAVTERWQKVDLRFDALPGLSLNAVDLFAVEFITKGPQDFLLDDLQLLGPWKLDPE
jgi:hypothetical protein